MKRSLIVGIVIFGMLLAPATSLSTASDWEDDDSWSYKWVYDYSDHEEEITQMIKNSSESLSMNITIDELEGGFVAMFTVKYKGMDNGYHKFDYEGGYYAENTIDISMNLEGDRMSGTYNTHTILDKLDSEFSGSLWIEEYEYEGPYSSSTAYGVVRQTVKTNGEMSMNMSTDMEMERDTYNFEGSMNYTIDMDWDMDLDINYTPPLPWLPPSSGETSNLPSKDVMGEYTGSINGYMNMEMEGTGAYSNISDIGSVDQNIDRSLQDTEYDISGDMQAMENKISKPSPIMGLFKLGGTGLYFQADRNSSEYPSTLLSSSVGRQTRAEYDSDEGFYSSYYMSRFGSANPSGSLSSGISTFSGESSSVKSESTSEEEVNSFMEDKEGFYEENIGSSSGIVPWFVFIPAVFLGAALGIGLYIRKKRKQKRIQGEPLIYQSGLGQTRKQRPMKGGHQQEPPQGSPGQSEQHRSQPKPHPRESEQPGVWDQQQTEPREGREGNLPQRSSEHRWQPDKDEKPRY